MMIQKRLLLISPFHTGSHRYWCEKVMSGLGEIDWTLLSLPGRHFSWRTGGAPLSLLKKMTSLSGEYDGVVATSLLDLATFKGLHPRLAQLPTWLYFHENQFAYPWTDRQQGQIEAQLRSIYSALAADRLLFNSEFNRKSFLNGARKLLDRLPEKGLFENLAPALDRSRILPVPVEICPDGRATSGDKTVLLWNQRWEHDKGPERLLLTLRELKQLKFKFRLNLIGEQFRSTPQALEIIQEEFATEINLLGWQNSRGDYWQALASSDMVLSTAHHEFQGLSVLEAMSAGCVPIVPDALSYPEFVPQWGRVVADPESFAIRFSERVIELAGNISDRQTQCREIALRYSVEKLLPNYRDEFSQSPCNAVLDWPN